MRDSEELGLGQAISEAVLEDTLQFLHRIVSKAAQVKCLGFPVVQSGFGILNNFVTTTSRDHPGPMLRGSSKSHRH